MATEKQSALNDEESAVTAGKKRRTNIVYLDRRFIDNWKQYVFQCLLVTIVIAIVLILLDSVYQTVLIAALGASAFVAFATPSLRASRPRNLIGGYVVAVAVGASISVIANLVGDTELLHEHTIHILFGALAVGLAMFIMVMTNTEHPPGAAIALGFVLNEWDLMTIIVVLAGIVSITVMKEFARSRLIDLF